MASHGWSQASGPGSAQEAAPARLLTQLPESLPEDLRKRALDASWRLRRERTLEFGHPVVVRLPDAEIKVEPIPHAPPARVPYTFRGRGGTTIVGALRLKSQSDPLATESPATASPEDAGHAWATALITYAELTCVAGSAPEISPAFVPTHGTRHILASYVVGHRRRLPDGHSAGDDAKAHAERIGVALGRHETWVRPHARGVPAAAELVFDWAGHHASSTGGHAAHQLSANAASRC